MRVAFAIPLIVGIFTLPTFQVQVAWMTTAIITIAASAAAISALLAYKSISCSSFNQVIRNKYTILSILTLFVSLGTYQTAAMFYWVFVAILLLNVDVKSWQQRRRSIIYFCVIPFLGMALYFIVVSLCIFVFTSLLPIPRLISLFQSASLTPYHFAILRDVNSKIIWFLNHPLIDGINLWNIYPKKIFIFVFACIFVVGLLCEISNHYRKSPEQFKKRIIWSSSLQKSGFILLLLPISILPNLIAEGTLSSYRSLVAFSPVVLVIICWGLIQIFDFLFGKRQQIIAVGCLSISVMIGALVAHNNVNKLIVEPQTSELKYVTSRLQKTNLTNLKNIAVIRPVNFNARYDEFNVLTTTYPQDVPLIIQVALLELKKEQLFINLNVSSIQTGEVNGADERTLVIDMSELEKTEH